MTPFNNKYCLLNSVIIGLIPRFEIAKDMYKYTYFEFI